MSRKKVEMKNVFFSVLGSQPIRFSELSSMTKSSSDQNQKRDPLALFVYLSSREVRQSAACTLYQVHLLSKDSSLHSPQPKSAGHSTLAYVVDLQCLYIATDRTPQHSSSRPCLAKFIDLFYQQQAAAAAAAAAPPSGYQR